MKSNKKTAKGIWRTRLIVQIRLKIILVSTILLVIVSSCKKDEPLKPNDPNPLTWKSKQGYFVPDIDAQKLFPEYVVLGGYPNPPTDSVKFYTGITDPKLENDIYQSLIDDGVPNPDEFMTKLQDLDFLAKINNDPYIARFLLTNPSNSSSQIYEQTTSDLNTILIESNGGVKYVDEAEPLGMGIVPSDFSGRAYVYISGLGVKTLYLNREFTEKNYGGAQRGTLLNEANELTANPGDRTSQNLQIMQIALGYTLDLNDADEWFNRHSSNPTTGATESTRFFVTRYGFNGADRSVEDIIGDRQINNPNSFEHPNNTMEEAVDAVRNLPVYVNLPNTILTMRPDMITTYKRLTGKEPLKTDGEYKISRASLTQLINDLDDLLDQNTELWDTYSEYLPITK